MSINELWSEIKNYIGHWQSIDQVEDKYLIFEIRRNANRLSEALMIMHLNPNITTEKIEATLNFKLTNNFKEILAGFYIRHEMNNGKRTGNDILSGRQLTRRRKNESWYYNDVIDYSQIDTRSNNNESSRFAMCISCQQPSMSKFMKRGKCMQCLGNDHD